MAQSVRLGGARIDITGQDAEFQRVMRRAARAYAQQEQQVRRLRIRMAAYNAVMVRLRGTVLALTAALGGRALIRTITQAQALENQLALVTENVTDLNTTWRELSQTAYDTRSALDTTIELYARLSQFIDVTTASQRELRLTVEATNTAIAISGVRAESAAASIYQLIQGLTSDQLRAEELRSVITQTPRLARAIADGLGVNIGRLRELGSAGVLSARRVISALIDQLPVLRAEFAKTHVTIAQSATRLSSAWLDFTRQLDNSLGVSKAIAATLGGAASALRALTPDTTPDTQAGELRDALLRVAELKTLYDEVTRRFDADPLSETLERSWENIRARLSDARGEVELIKLSMKVLADETERVRVNIDAVEGFQSEQAYRLRAYGGAGLGRGRILEAMSNADLLAQGDARIAAENERINAELDEQAKERERLLDLARRAAEAERDRLTDLQTQVDLMREQVQIAGAVARGGGRGGDPRQFMTTSAQSNQAIENERRIDLWAKEREAAERAAKAIQAAQTRAADAIAQSFGDAFGQVITGFQSLSSAARSILSAIISQLTQLYIAGPITRALGSVLPGLPPPGLASGGPVAAGRPYIVGERGPELFVPDVAGTIAASGRFGGMRVENLVGVIQSSDGPAVRAALAQALPQIIEAAEARVLEDLTRPSSARRAVLGR